MMTTTRTVPSKEKVRSLLTAHQAELRTMGVKRLGLFGSFVRGEQHADSDIDLLVEFEPGQKTFDHFRLRLIC